MKEEEIRKFVRLGYADVARGSGSCCGPKKNSGCCGSIDSFKNASKAIGYTDEDVESVPDGANLGLGCGNPVALASIREGEVVLDLGSGAGFDCFLAAGRVGAKGKVIGVDMTPEMLEKARENAEKGGYKNVEFRLGEIENLPVADNTVDLIISNCVINLSPQKEQVFREAYRVLKPGGRIMVSDIVLLGELPESVKKSVVAYIGCVAGATIKENYLDAITKAGFVNVKTVDESKFDMEFVSGDPTVKQVLCDENISKADLVKAGNSIRSIKVSAVKPGK